MKTVFQLRAVEIVKVDSNSGDPVDAYIEEAYWVDSLEPLNETELDALANAAPEVVAEMWTDEMITRAEARSEYLYGGDR